MAKGNSPIRILSPWTEQNPLMLSQDFPDPVFQLDALLFVLNALLRDACSRLITVSRAACQLCLIFTLEDGTQRLSIQLGEPTRSTDRILRLIRHRLEHFKLAGAVTSLSIEISESTPFTGRQFSVIYRSGLSEAIADVTARLQDRLGRSRFSIPEHQSRHCPEAAWFKRSVEAASDTFPRINSNKPEHASNRTRIPLNENPYLPTTTTSIARQSTAGHRRCTPLEEVFK